MRCVFVLLMLALVRVASADSSDAGVSASDVRAVVVGDGDAGVPASDAHAVVARDAGVAATDTHAVARDAGTAATNTHAVARDAGIAATDTHAVSSAEPDEIERGAPELPAGESLVRADQAA